MKSPMFETSVHSHQLLRKCGRLHLEVSHRPRAEIHGDEWIAEIDLGIGAGSLDQRGGDGAAAFFRPKLSMLYLCGINSWERRWKSRRVA
jgi:hypothetical protein